MLKSLLSNIARSSKTPLSRTTRHPLVVPKQKITRQQLREQYLNILRAKGKKAIALGQRGRNAIVTGVGHSMPYKRQMRGQGLTAKNATTALKSIRETKAYKKARVTLSQAKVGIESQISRRRAIDALAKKKKELKLQQQANRKTVKNLKAVGSKPTKQQRREFRETEKQYNTAKRELSNSVSKKELLARKVIKNPRKALGGVTVGGLAIADIMGAADGVLPNVGQKLLEKMEK